MARVKGQKRAKLWATTVVEICRRLGLPRKPLTQYELHELLIECVGNAAPSIRTMRRWTTPESIGTKYAKMLADLSGWTRAQVLGDAPWPPEPDKKGLSSLLEPRTGLRGTPGGPDSSNRRWRRMTEIVARVLARAILDTMATQVAGLPDSAPAVGAAIRSFALALNSRLGLDASALMAVADLVRRGGPVDPGSIAQAVESSLQQEEVMKTPAGQAELANLLDSMIVSLMPLKIDVSQLGDVADLLRKGGL